MAIAGNCSCIPGIQAIHGHKKTPHPFPGAGFWILRLVLLRRALPRTSVGNEKYEYEDEKRNLARAQEPGNQPGLAGLGHCAGAVAVRHESNVTDDPDRVNCFFRICAAFEANAREVVRSRTPRRPDG